MGNINYIQKLATSQGILVEEEITKVIEVWEGKPKRMIQVLWKQVLFDKNCSTLSMARETFMATSDQKPASNTAN